MRACVCVLCVVEMGPSKATLEKKIEVRNCRLLFFNQLEIASANFSMVGGRPVELFVGKPRFSGIVAVSRLLCSCLACLLVTSSSKRGSGHLRICSSQL